MFGKEHILSSPLRLARTLSETSTGKRTRRRFTDEQVSLLEALYCKTPHPTREQRDTLAKQNNLDTRAVTVWFQNKRQYGRRQATKRTTKSDPLSSPFSDAPGKTIHTARSSSPAFDDLSRTSDASTPTSTHHSLTPTGACKRRRDSTTSDVGARPSPATRTLSLDRIAARVERPHAFARERDARWPSTPPRRAHSCASLPFFLRAPPPPRALWETMPSSPVQPSSPEMGHSPLLDFDFGQGRLKRQRTLEWACARERAGGYQMKAEADGEDPLVLDLGGDTDVETEPDVHEAVTPKSNSRGEGAGIAGAESWEEQRLVDGDKENRPYRWMKIRKETDAKEIKEAAGRVRDEDMMDAALTLCGLGGRA
ncbi:homeobox-domain-containing protein [Daedalea quercina L-15889]|uniref:Homeobox-domain-containing protein n=1 Tax=Daedalea quercina L-15889 TaxID=1314783 RepID=A0A165L4W9_9APHY|nr:homeobox-domain-containing protein [Daedalea quercina L-15889]